jgi:uncharacterized membrane protein
MFPYLLALHVTAGAVALLSGPVPMLSRKGGWLHKRSGDVFATAMALAAVLAFTLAAMRRDVLLLGIAVLTFFLIYNGVRALAFRRGSTARVPDHIVCVLTAGFSAWLFWHGLLNGDVTPLFFGVGGVVLCLQQDSRLDTPPSDWIAVHLAFMGGAYIATVSAFLVVNLTYLPKPVVFIGPTCVGAPFIAMALRRLRRKSPTGPMIEQQA